MAYATADVLTAMEADSGIVARELRVDGGASQNDWLMAFQAGVLGLPVRRPSLVETTALGAAGLAGLATGVWRSGEEFLGALGEATDFPPELTAPLREEALAGWRRAVATARAWSGWTDPGS
jgi:glycerol kinase